jgi:hypothetical protein
LPSLLDIKLKGRRAIHSRASFDVTYIDDDHPDGLAFAVDYAGQGLRARYHTKLARNGDLDGTYAEVIEGIERLVFSDENVAEVSAALVANGEPPLVLNRTGRVTIDAVKGAVFSLDSEEPADGPIETIWTVARVEG